MFHRLGSRVARGDGSRADRKNWCTDLANAVDTGRYTPFGVALKTRLPLRLIDPW